MKVIISCEQRVRYGQIREVPDELYQQYLKAIEDGERDQWFHRLAEHRRDVTDVLDADDFDDVEMVPYKAREVATP